MHAELDRLVVHGHHSQICGISAVVCGGSEHRGVCDLGMLVLCPCIRDLRWRHLRKILAAQDGPLARRNSKETNCHGSSVLGVLLRLQEQLKALILGVPDPQVRPLLGALCSAHDSHDHHNVLGCQRRWELDLIPPGTRSGVPSHHKIGALVSRVDAGGQSHPVQGLCRVPLVVTIGLVQTHAGGPNFHSFNNRDNWMTAVHGNHSSKHHRLRLECRGELLGLRLVRDPSPVFFTGLLELALPLVLVRPNLDVRWRGRLHRRRQGSRRQCWNTHCGLGVIAVAQRVRDSAVADAHV
mmetsp:Transcript_33142/g.79921  ORF Transcript_33142/g.79921 Transcript_33142/m.79921 type:complete len:296 (-) Transcript_33142:193-1080(-)